MLLDRGWSYGAVMGMLGVGQLVAAAIIVLAYPETAHRALEELNPEDVTPESPTLAATPVSGATTIQSR